MRNTNVKNIALCGLLAAVAIVIMCLGTLIPFATYTCPILCALICNLIRKYCGRKWSWIWYAVVSLLSLLVGTDREAAVVFMLLGYYPCVKDFMDNMPLSWIWKFLYFNLTACSIYCISAFILGLPDVVADFAQLGWIGMLVVILLVNVTLFIMDYLMSSKAKRKIK